MGQKIHPTGYRVGIIEPWASRWHGGKHDFAKFLLQDKQIRDHIFKDYGSAGIPRIEIERTGDAVNVILFTARPGVLVGRKGMRIDQLKGELQAFAGMTVHLTIHEIKRPELSAGLVAEVIADQLKRRMAFRRAVKKAVQTTIQAGAQGIKVQISGRLGGAEMSRVLAEREGRVPLSTIQSHIEYGTAQAMTTYGVIGVKCWIYKGEIERGQKVNYRVTSAAGGRFDRGGPGGGPGGPGGGGGSRRGGGGGRRGGGGRGGGGGRRGGSGSRGGGGR
jgi:small subunit ribosomal protein S3